MKLFSFLAVTAIAGVAAGVIYADKIKAIAAGVSKHFKDSEDPDIQDSLDEPEYEFMFNSDGEDISSENVEF